MPKTLERRIIERPVEVRTNRDGTYGVTGYASIFDTEAHGEVIRASAYNRTLAQRDDAPMNTGGCGLRAGFGSTHTGSKLTYWP